MDQDSERTSSSLVPGKVGSRRSHSRAPASGLRQGIVAGIDELDSLGQLSLRTSHGNDAQTKHSSDSSADDMTIVAHSGRVSVPPSAELASPGDLEAAASAAGAFESEDWDSMALHRSASGVNPKPLSERPPSGEGALSQRQDSNVPRPRKSTTQKRGVHSGLMWQWAFAFLTGIIAAWYVLQQPVPEQRPRAYLSGR